MAGERDHAVARKRLFLIPVMTASGVRQNISDYRNWGRKLPRHERPQLVRQLCSERGWHMPAPTYSVTPVVVTLSAVKSSSS